MRFVSLFTGVGGFDLGFERAGMTCVAQVERDKFARQVLRKHYPNVDLHEDVRHVGKHNLPPAVDLVCGGFPCQDVSVAGKRAGLAGERSGLWAEFARIVGEVKPQWVVIENVPGLLSSNDGRDFAVVVRGLVECGYRVVWRVLDSQHFGVAQRRRRVFVVGSLGDGRAADVLFESEGGSGGVATGAKAREAATATAVREPVVYDTTQVTSLANGSNPQPGAPSHPLAASAHPPVLTYRSRHSSEHVSSRIAGALSARDAKGGYYPALMATLPASGSGTMRTGGQNAERDFLIPVGFRPNNSITAGGISACVDQVPALRASDMKGSHPAVAFLPGQGARAGSVAAGKISPTLKSSPSGTNQVPGVTHYGRVRRLTPRECERLQGFPDDWTDMVSDTQRYRQMGNAVTVNVAEWIGRRIVAAHGSR